jgi:hypothetical protein
MVIDMRSYLKSGNYADVFAVGGRAYKLFKSGPDVSLFMWRVQILCETELPSIGA